MTILSLHNQLRLSEVVVDIQKLVQLDSVWTQYLTTTSTIPSTDVPMLQDLARQLGTQSDAIGKHTQFLDELADQHSKQLNDAYEDAVGNTANFFLKESIAKHGSVAALVKAKAQIVRREAPLNKRDVEEKIQKIVDGKHVPGDMRSILGCAIGVILVVAGAIAGSNSAVRAGVALESIYCVS